MENFTEQNVFFVKFQDTINTSFILFEKKLEDLLYSLAESPLVYSIVEKCLKDYDYSSAKTKSLVMPSISSKGGFYPPDDRRDFIAFSFSVLHEVFERKLLFTDLLDLYFDGSGYKEKFDNFKERLLSRLYISVVSVVEDLNKIYISNSEELNVETVDKKDDITILKNYINEQKIKFEDKEYLIYFIDAITEGKSEDVCLKAIDYILSNYKKGKEINIKILEALEVK